MLRRIVLKVLAVSLPACHFATALPHEVEELLEFYCYDCHGYGKQDGDVRLDQLDFDSDDPLDREIWEKAWLNVRTGLMPPPDAEPLENADRTDLLTWLEKGPLDIDRSNPDPGQTTVRRHNRAEYQNTISDLLGIHYNTAESFPPDDTGYGFDTIGDVLSISPLLGERYFEAAKAIMAKALPENAASYPTLNIWAPGFVNPTHQKETGRLLNTTHSQAVEATRWLNQEGEYELSLEFQIKGDHLEESNETHLILFLNKNEVAREKLKPNSQGLLTFSTQVHLSSQEHTFALQLHSPQKDQGLTASIKKLSIIGPLNTQERDYPESYLRIIAKEQQPESKEQWPLKSREVLRDFASRAWRRPVSEKTLDRLTLLANETSAAENSFEAGIRQAGTAILTSPRFLLRTEGIAEGQEQEEYPLIDEWALAARLSYFLWSSLPDEKLREHARQGTLRAHLREEVERMLNDPKANRMTQNFVGQWLQARDVSTVAMRPEKVLKVIYNEGQRVFNQSLRKDMQEETELLFQHILEQHLPATELISADYTFLNKRLAQFYDVPGVESERHQKVHGKRGGILTQGTFLVVTSNPTRTSPVKRGLFILDNLLGTPPPPAPPVVPALESSSRKNTKMTMKELLAEHRKNPDCRSCHARMDPIGLAFENYSAIGTYRKIANGQPIEADGQLVTGEKFNGVEELKRILVTEKKDDFHRCLVEKLLTYAIGRGIEPHDAPASDAIITQMEAENGSLRETIHAIIESIPFQKTRQKQEN